MKGRKFMFDIFVAIFVSLIILSQTKIDASAMWSNGERVGWYNKMTDGRSIYYWIDPSNEYTVSIPAAVYKLMYPSSGLVNNNVLTMTTDNNQSKMDFYQIYSLNTPTVASCSSFRKNSNGIYYQMPISEKDSYDWVYAEIKLNDAKLAEYTATKREKVILHEMLHGFGLKDLYNTINSGSIMYGYVTGSATELTYESNAVLVTKY